MKLNKYTPDDFSIGFCADSTVDTMAKGATPNAYNVEMLRGSLKTMKGFSKHTSAPIIYNGEAYKPVKLMTYYSYLSTAYSNNDVMPIIASTGGVLGIFIYKNNEWVALQTNISVADMGYVNYYVKRNSLLLCNALDGMYKLEREKVTFIEDSLPISAMTLHFERVWGTGDTMYPNKVFYSAVNDPECWDADKGAGELSITTHDGDMFIGIATVFDDVVLYRQKSLFRISGSSPETYSLKQIPSESGACGPNAIANDGKNSFFVGVNGIYEYNGSSAQVILNDRLSLFFAERVNRSKLYNCSAVIHNGKLFVSLACDSSRSNNCIIEYDIQQKVINIRKNCNAHLLNVFNGELYFCDEDGNIFKFDGSDSYADESIDAHYETPYTDMGGKSRLKTLDNICFSARGNGNVIITAITENGASSSCVTLTDENEFHLYRIDMYNTGRRYKFCIDNSEGSIFEISDLEIYYEEEDED